MLRNFLKIAYRNLLKNKVFSVVNILGLAIGMAACFFIFQYVHFETSFDKFHKNAANLYRVPISLTGSLGGNGTEVTSSPGTGPSMRAEFPEVVDFARVAPLSLFTRTTAISYTDRHSNRIAFNEDKVFAADSSFLKIFSFPFVTGDSERALTESRSVVLSETEARKYFGNEDPLGKTLYLNREEPLKVTGVFKDVPENAHFKFDMLVSLRTFLHHEDDDTWNWPEFYTYVLLAPGTDPKKVEAKFPAFAERHLGNIMKALSFRTTFHLQRVTDIHLTSGYSREPEPTGSEREIVLLSLVSLLILVIAWINYINLTTAKSMERAREVGLRKVVGASRKQLVGQFIMESFIVNLLALFVAALIVFACYPWFGPFIGRNLSSGALSRGLLSEPGFWLTLLSIFAISAFLVGAYPAFVLSTFKPVTVLKGKFYQSKTGILRRKALVSFQFTLSILLIAATTMVYKQLSFMRTQPSGYKRKEIVIVTAPAAYDSATSVNMHLFKEEILKNPSVSNITSSSDIPGQMVFDMNSVRKAYEDHTHNFGAYQLRIDDHFINTYHMEMAAGRDLLPQDTSRIFSGRKVKVLVNEAVVKGLGYSSNEAAVNQDIIFEGGQDIKAVIIGVVKNHHQRSLKEPFDPILYYYPVSDGQKYLSLNVNINSLSQNMAGIEALFRSRFPGHPFDYFFLDDFFNRQYQSDQQFGKVFALFTFLTIFVASLGLFGLSGFIVRLRTKEAGIRKVLGATAYSIVVLFARDFVKIVGLATVIAVPVIYWMSDRWFRNYAFHTHLSLFNYLLPSLLLLIISLLTVWAQSMKTVAANPIEALRSE